MTPEINPYATPTAIPPVDAPSDGNRRRVFAVSIAAILLIGSPIAAAYAVFDTESILVSGALATLLAIALGWLSARKELRMMIAISVATLVFTVGCFLTIFLMEWSPGDAHDPISGATIVFASVIQSGWFVVRQVWRQRLDLESAG